MVRDAMADPVEATELFDVDADQLARRFAFVPAHRLGQFEGLQFITAVTLEDDADAA
jgi:hypothetical protein